MPELISIIDLDDTFVTSYKKRKADVKYEAVGQNSKGDWITFRDDKHRLLFNILSEKGLLIPATGRPSRSLACLNLVFPSFKIVSHGAIILDEKGGLVREWLIENKLASYRGLLEKLAIELQPYAQDISSDFRYKLVEDHGEIVYLSVKGDAKKLKQFHAFLLLKELLPEGFVLHYNHRNLAVLPPSSSKAKALAWLFKHYLPQDALLLGFGDSISDLPFMGLCDYAVYPQKSQISTSIHELSH